MKPRSADPMRVARGLSWAVVVLMTIVSAGGVFWGGLYQDNELISAVWPGQDPVTLFVAVPLLALGLVLEARGSARGRLLWIGMLAYALYGYLFYLVGAAFNVFFLLYVALVALSLYALLFSVPRIDAQAIADRFRGGRAKGIALVYMLVSGCGLGLMWTGLSLSYVFTGDVPGPIVSSGHPTGVVFALDLTIIVPAMFLGSAWLAKNRPWGWVLASVLAVKGTVYTLGLVVATIVVQRAGLASGSELPVWATLTVLGAVSGTALMLSLRPSSIDAKTTLTAA